MDKSRFLGDNGARLTKGLFLEYADPDRPNEPLYRLSRKYDGPLPSLYHLYMDCKDITEAKFVENYLYDLRHWEMLCRTPFFRDEIAEWRKELALMLRYDAVRFLERDASSTSKTATSSAKYLLDKVYKVPNTPGRPASKEVHDSTPSMGDVHEDVIRIFKNAV
jgi:hypothetical protein